MRLQMSYLWAVLLVCTAFTAIVGSSCANTDPAIGIYFDEVASTSCLGWLYYTPITARIVLTDPAGDVAGWELSIAAGPTLVIVPGTISGDGINTLQYPEYSVGLSSPLQQTNAGICLAELVIVALAPGDISVTAVANPSLPGSTGPVISYDGMIGELAVTNQSDPFGVGVQARIGADCVAGPNTGFSLSEYLDRYTESLETGDAVVRKSDNMPPNYSGANTGGWVRALYRSGYCFLGSVQDIEYRCVYTEDDGADALAAIKLSVLVNYWGTSSETQIVDTPYSATDACVQYVDDEYYASYQVGDTLFVIGQVNDERYKCLKSGVYRYSGNTLGDPRGGQHDWSSIDSLAVALAGRRAVVSQRNVADIVIRGNVQSVSVDGSCRVAVVQVSEYMKGMGQGDLQVRMCHSESIKSVEDYELAPPIEAGEDVIMMIVEWGGAYRLIGGAHGLYKVQGDHVFESSGRIWGDVSIIEAVVGGGQ